MLRYVDDVDIKSAAGKIDVVPLLAGSHGSTVTLGFGTICRSSCRNSCCFTHQSHVIENVCIHACVQNGDKGSHRSW